MTDAKTDIAQGSLAQTKQHELHCI